MSEKISESKQEIEQFVLWSMEIKVTLIFIPSIIYIEMKWLFPILFSSNINDPSAKRYS